MNNASISKKNSRLICSCGSQKLFESCCGPIHRDHQLATTPEELMRSRYSAYVHSNQDFLLQTWDPLSSPESLKLDEKIQWLGLIVWSSTLAQDDTDRGFVHYTAHSIQNNHLVELEESSVFIRRNGLWYYHDGKVSTSSTPITRNAPCPCGSKKKFKRCCSS